jgi:hypothetical protein
MSRFFPWPAVGALFRILHPGASRGVTHFISAREMPDHTLKDIGLSRLEKSPSAFGRPNRLARYKPF